MKRLGLIPIISLLLLVLLNAGCKKDETEYRSTANIVVVNAWAGGTPLKAQVGATGGFAWSRASNLAYGAAATYSGYTGESTVNVVSAADTTKVLFQRSIGLGPVSTLYITGLSSATDTIFRAEMAIPYINAGDISAEMAMHVRFVNLSPNSTPINIRLAGSTANEVAGLAYKGISAFRKYVALSSTANYVFEARDAATNALLASFTLNTGATRYRSASVIIRGLAPIPSNPYPMGMFQVNYN